MVNNRMTEGVGKKIVEALKMQSDIEITPVHETAVPNFDTEQALNNAKAVTPTIVEEEPVHEEFHFDEDTFKEDDFPSFDEQPVIQPQPTQQQTISQINIPQQQTFINPDLDDFEIPSNVAVLKQLITKLPTGVTKQTGALIIKQTMEALGISMKSVLQEAQQVQEGLNNSSRECQASIMEYKKQIGILEKQAQKYQRQYAALNDIISLFVQTNI